MIDVESQVYTKVANALLAAYPGILVTSRTIFEPAEYPCVCIEQTDSYALARTRDSASTQNHMEIAYTVNVFSNMPNTAKSEAKAIMNLVDETMTDLGFTVMGIVPMAMSEAQKYRLTARYRAVVGKDETIYRS